MGKTCAPHALVKRQAHLQALLERFGCPVVSPVRDLRGRRSAAACGRGTLPCGSGKQASRRPLSIGRLSGLAEGQDDRVARVEQGAVASVRAGASNDRCWCPLDPRFLPCTSQRQASSAMCQLLTHAAQQTACRCCKGASSQNKEARAIGVAVYRHVGRITHAASTAFAVITWIILQFLGTCASIAGILPWHCAGLVQ
jgi:hypothetical protein